MIPRRLVHCFMIIACAALSGCGWFGSKPSEKVVVAPIKASVQARKDLTNVAKKVEDAATFEALETYIKKFEDPEQKWTWSDLNDIVVHGNFSIQTKVAYEKWRTATIAEAAKR